MLKQFWNDYGAPMAIFLALAIMAMAGLWAYVEWGLM